jgi:glycosyltransferase involved in cell wall biosynthesis
MDVSICSTTYNLSNYVAQAIESWLSQKTNYTFEIIICDDGSTDNTKEILDTYIEKYPEKIKVVYNVHIGKMPNFLMSLSLAKGKYIAICDGDDYWIDDKKLQKQVDFLENNLDFVACFTNSILKDQITGEEKVAKTRIWDIADSKGLLYHDDFDKTDLPLSPGHISSYVFRNNLFIEFPDWMYKDIVTDFPIFMLVSKYGKAKFINEITSVYRIHNEGVSTRKYTFEKYYTTRIFMYKKVDALFEYKHHKFIKALMVKHHLNAYYYYLNNNLFGHGFKIILTYKSFNLKFYLNLVKQLGKIYYKKLVSYKNVSRLKFYRNSN